MVEHMPYGGLPPVPGELLMRFNLDPVLMVALVALGLWQVNHVLSFAYVSPAAAARHRLCAALGWSAAAVALISPLCALSVALFSARVGQHLILLLIAAPLIAYGWPKSTHPGRRG